MAGSAVVGGLILALIEGCGILITRMTADNFRPMDPSAMQDPAQLNSQPPSSFGQQQQYQSGLRLMVVICLSLTLLFSISLADRPLNMMSFFKLQKSLKNVQSEFRCRKESKI